MFLKVRLYCWLRGSGRTPKQPKRSAGQGTDAHSTFDQVNPHLTEHFRAIVIEIQPPNLVAKHGIDCRQRRRGFGLAEAQTYRFAAKATDETYRRPEYWTKRCVKPRGRLRWHETMFVSSRKLIAATPAMSQLSVQRECVRGFCRLLRSIPLPASLPSLPGATRLPSGRRPWQRFRRSLRPSSPWGCFRQPHRHDNQVHGLPESDMSRPSLTSMLFRGRSCNTLVMDCLLSVVRKSLP